MGVKHQSREQHRQNGGDQVGEKEALLKLRVVVDRGVDAVVGGCGRNH